MNVEYIKRYVGKKVLVILKNNFKYTFVMPDFEGNSFYIKDKYNHDVTIDCDMVSLISEVGDYNDR